MRTLFRVLLYVFLFAAFVFGALYFCFPGQVAEIALQLERSRAGLVNHDLDISSAGETTHIAYLDGGDPAAPPLLLLHGIGADKDNWTRVAHFLTPHYRVIAVDLPGFGESSKPTDASYGIDDQVRNVAMIAAALHLDHFDLGGNSMGGWIGAAYAVAHPDQVRSLWLLDSAGLDTARPSEMFTRIKSGKPVPIFARNGEEFRELEHFVFVRPPYVPGAVLNALARREAQNYDLNVRIFDQLRQDLQTKPLENQIKNLPTPTLIVWGARDRVLDASGAEILHGLLPNSQVSIMPDIGHMPMLEAPQLTAENYLRFRNGLVAK